MGGTIYRIAVICLLITVFGCKKESVKNENIKNRKDEISNLNFDKILKINDLIYGSNDSGSFFTTSYDNGVYYDPKNGNDMGNLVTFLVPKDFLFFQKHSQYLENDEYEPLQVYINKLSIEEYKKIFDIYVFLIDKKYLVPTPGYDSPYNYTEKYQTDVYQYRDKSWNKIDSFVVNSEEKDLKEPQWRYDFIEKKSKEIQTVFFDSISKLKIDDSWYRDYLLSLDSYEPGYYYGHYIKISKDSSYIAERYFKDLLIPYQNEDTLFLYHKKCFFESSKYLKNKQIPEVKIVRIKDKYYISSEVFDLKKSISTKPDKYGFLVSQAN